MSNTLQLTLKRQWFDLMFKGVKKLEFRKDSKWIRSRLIGKKYQLIKFTNGYGKDKPFFICKYNGFEILKKNKKYTFENFDVNINKGDFMIKLGTIVSFDNIKD